MVVLSADRTQRSHLHLDMQSRSQSSVRAEQLVRGVRGISKRDRTARRGDRAAAQLVGRRVRVPQKYTEVEDDGDGFCFGATVIHAGANRALIRFDYTGDVEGWCLALVRQWLEADTDPLCLAFQGSRLD